MAYSKKNSFSKKRKTIRRNMKGGSLNEDLIFAASFGNLSDVKSALDAGANVDATDKIGSTALHVASYNGHDEVVTALIAAGANIEAKDEDGWTALYLASTEGNTEVVNELLENGADVNKTNNDGETALMRASMEGYDEVVKLLLENGADVNKTNNDGETALDIADNDEIKKLLQEAKQLQDKLRNLDSRFISIFKKLGIYNDHTRINIAVDFFDEKGAESLEDLKYGQLVKKFCKKMKLKYVKRDRLRELIFREIGIPDNQKDFTDSEGGGKKKSKRTKRKTRRTRKNK